MCIEQLIIQREEYTWVINTTRESRSQYEIICAETSRFTLVQASLDKFRTVGLLVGANLVLVWIRYIQRLGVHDERSEPVIF